MSTIRFTVITTSTPEQFVAGLTDFGPGRAKLFANSSDGYLKVHAQGPTYADVTEGTPAVWERLSYDWSDPNHVVLKTTDSNSGAARPATPTPSTAGPTARRRSTSRSCARARTRRAA